MRLSLLPTALLLSFSTALHLPNFQPFLNALSLPITLADYIPPNPNARETLTFRPAHDLLKRQFSNTCPTNFKDCANLGAPNLCCASAAVCSPDFAGNVACCPSGAACSGTIAGVITAGTVNSVGSFIPTGTTTAGGAGATTTNVFGVSTTTSAVLVPASTATTVGDGGTTGSGTGFIIAGSSTVATPALAVRGAQVVSSYIYFLAATFANHLCSH